MAVEPRRLSTMFRLSRLLCVLLLAASATGCAKLVYNRLDTLAALYVGDLVSLDDQQSSDLRAWLAQTLQWHREKELGRYATFLRELSSEDRAAFGSRRVPAPVRPGRRIRLATSLRRPRRRRRRLLLELTPAQVEELLANLEEKSQRALRGHRCKEIRNGSWQAKRIKDNAATGEALDRRDHRRAEAAGARDVAADSADDQEWLESQRHWRAALRNALGNAFSNRGTARERILQLLREPDTQWTAQYKTKEASNREQLLSLLTALDASLTPAQREHMQRELTDLAERLEALTEE